MCSVQCAGACAGSLLDILKERLTLPASRHGVLDEATIATVLREVLKGLDYFHSRGQIHRCVPPLPPPPPPASFASCLAQQPLPRARHPYVRVRTYSRSPRLGRRVLEPRASASLPLRAGRTQHDDDETEQAHRRRLACTRT